jgi:polysaccharide export outer membrane protein
MFFYFRKKNSYTLCLPIALFGTFLLNSCAPIVRSNAYFKTLSKDTSIQGFITNDFESKIQKNDILTIKVSSMSKEMDDIFNLSNSSTNPGQQASTTTTGYLVDEKGTVTVHYAGTVTAEGLTRKELKAKIENLLSPFMKEPIISVQYLNHKVTVLGEVFKPQVLNMPEEQLSIIDVLVSSGDVKENARVSDILIIREEKNEKKVKHINLEDHSIFTSPWYYLKSNDIVYVIPDSERYVREEKRRNLQITLSLIVSMVSLAIIVLNVVVK